MTPADYRLLSELQQRLSAPEDFEPWCRQAWATELEQLLERNEARVFGNDVVMLLDEAEPEGKVNNSDSRIIEPESTFAYNLDEAGRNDFLFGYHAIDDGEEFRISLGELTYLLSNKYADAKQRYASGPPVEAFYGFGLGWGAPVNYQGRAFNQAGGNYSIVLTGVFVKLTAIKEEDLRTFNQELRALLNQASTDPDCHLRDQVSLTLTWWS